MKKLIRKLLAFLEAKFPDRVQVTLEEYNALYAQLGAYNQVLQAFDKKVYELNNELQALKAEPLNLKELKADVQKCKDEVSKLHVVMGFSGSASGGRLER